MQFLECAPGAPNWGLALLMRPAEGLLPAYRSCACRYGVAQTHAAPIIAVLSPGGSIRTSIAQGSSEVFVQKRGLSSGYHLLPKKLPVVVTSHSANRLARRAGRSLLVDGVNAQKGVVSRAAGAT